MPTKFEPRLHEKHNFMSSNHEPFQVELYRTENAVFLFAAPWTRQLNKKYLWPILIGLMFLTPFLSLLFIALLLDEATGQAMKYGLVVPGFVLSQLLCWGYFFYLARYHTKSYAITIDGNSVRVDCWNNDGNGKSRVFPRTATHKIFHNRDDPEDVVFIFGKNRCHFHVPTRHEAEWIIKSFERILTEIPFTDTNLPQQKTRPQIADDDSGKNVRERLSLDGLRLEKIIPISERHLNEEIPAGTLFTVKCSVCGAVIPENDYLLNQRVAKCHDCGALSLIPEFSIPPFDQIDGKGVCHHENGRLSLEQRPYRDILPLIGFGFLMFFTSAAIISSLINEDKPIFSGVNLFLFSFTAYWLLMVLLYFFESRSIVLANGRCRLEWRWFFLSWGRTIPLGEILEMRAKELVFTALKVEYLWHGRKKMFKFGAANSGEDERIRALFNRVLYAENKSETAPGERPVFGGVDNFNLCKTAMAYCPSCGAGQEVEQFELSRPENKCGSCGKNIPVGDFRYIPEMELAALNRPLGLECNEVGGETEISYRPQFGLGMKLLILGFAGTMIAFSILSPFFIAYVIYDYFGERLLDGMWRSPMFVVIFIGAISGLVTFAFMCLLLFIQFSEMIRCLFGGWRVRLGKDGVWLEYRQGKNRKEIFTPRDSILGLELAGTGTRSLKPRWRIYMMESGPGTEFFSPRLKTKNAEPIYLPTIQNLERLPERTFSRWLLIKLAHYIASHLVSQYR